MLTFRRTLIALACTASLVLAACGEKTVETSDAEDEISEKLAQQGTPKPKEVDCPDDMKAKKGEEYTCKVTGPNDEKVDVKLTMLDDDGRFEFELQQ